jgi:glucosamine--fructose-6-phosphate aminotransferase (isomerizing)
VLAVKPLGKFPDRFLEEVAGQPEAIRRAARGLVAQRSALVSVHEAMASCIETVFTGMGASYDVAHVPITLLTQRGVRAWNMDAAELLHYRLPAIGPDTLLICVSQSGESAEPVGVAQELRRWTLPPTVVSVTNGLDNTLARAATIRLDTCAGAETGPSTMTFAASVVVLAAIADRAEGTAIAADALERLLAEPEAEADRLAGWLGDRRRLVLLGRGCVRAAAEMGALTIKEAAAWPAESLQAAQFRHGPLELAGPDLAAIVFATEDRTRRLDLALAGDLVAAGSAVLVVSQGGDAPRGARAVAIGQVPEPLAPAVAILPAQLLAWGLARAAGRVPGEFTMSAKVTLEE